MICPNLKDNICSIASTIAGKSVLPIISQCEFCSNKTEPAQAINKVTISLAIKNAIDTSTRNDIVKKYSHVLQILPPGPGKTEGPGTELKKLISWFHSPEKKKCSRCSNRIQKMNTWGPDECEKRIHTIIRWLKHSARIHKIPFFEPAVKLLIRKAIKNSRLQLQQPPGKTAP